ncbi:MAG: hypothetical protein KBS65_02840, partial [Prevotella sp.]|nr:hypothetical protein [Candidatus Equicola stercoris]
TKVNPLTVINNVASDRLMMEMDKMGSAPFNFTDVVLVEQTASVPELTAPQVPTVAKFLHNGQLVIRKDGKKFNVGGVEIR